MNNILSYLVPSSAMATGPRFVEPAPAGISGPDALALAERHRCTDEVLRQNYARARFKLYKESFGDLVAAKVDQTRNDGETKSELIKHVSMALNVALDITRQVCVVWRHGAKRTIEDIADDSLDAYRELVKRSRLDMCTVTWNQLAFLCGPAIIVPTPRKQRIQWDTLLPHFYTVKPDPEDPTGVPLAVAWSVREDDDPEGVDTIVLDGESWRRLNTKRGKPEVLSEVPHGIGAFPGQPLRFDCPVDDTWPWYGNDNKRMVDVTLDVAVINAALSMVRKSQCHKLLVAIGNLSETAREQKADPELGVMLNARSPDQVRVDALDFETGPDGFIKHALWLKEQAVEAFGIPGHAVTFDMRGGSEGERMAFTHEGLTEIREMQIPHAVEFEHGLSWKMCKMARNFQLPGHMDLPTMEQVQAGFHVQFPKLGRVFNDPNAEMAYTDWSLGNGWTSRVEEFRRRNPTLTDDQARGLMTKYIDEETEWINRITRRDQAANPDGNLETLAQAAGRQGGEQSAFLRRSPDGDND